MNSKTDPRERPLKDGLLALAERLDSMLCDNCELSLLWCECGESEED